MSRTRILHLADLHLGAGHDYLGPRAAQRREEADGLLGRLVDFALRPELGIGGVIIAGDLFDLHNPPQRLVERVISELERLEAGGIRLLTVPGNHDEFSYPDAVYRSFAGRWPGTLATEPTPARVARWDLDGEAVDLYAMAFTAGRSHPPFDRFEVEPGPQRKIAVLHGSLDVDWSDRSLPLRSLELARLGLDYVALGHIHKPMERRVGAAWACYPGRIEGGGFDDPGGAGIVTVDLAERQLRPQRSPFPSRALGIQRWNVSGIGTEEELLARIERVADPEAAMRLHLAGAPGFPLQMEKIRLRMGPRFFHLEIVTSEAGGLPPDLREAAAEPTVRGLFARIATERIAAERLAKADPARLELLEAALRFGWAAFQTPGDGSGREGGDLWGGVSGGSGGRRR